MQVTTENVWTDNIEQKLQNATSALPALDSKSAKVLLITVILYFLYLYKMVRFVIIGSPIKRISLYYRPTTSWFSNLYLGVNIEIIEGIGWSWTLDVHVYNSAYVGVLGLIMNQNVSIWA